MMQFKNKKLLERNKSVKPTAINRVVCFCYSQKDVDLLNDPFHFLIPQLFPFYGRVSGSTTRAIQLISNAIHITEVFKGY